MCFVTVIFWLLPLSIWTLLGTIKWTDYIGRLRNTHFLSSVEKRVKEEKGSKGS